MNNPGIGSQSPGMIQAPSIGRVVHVKDGSLTFAAIITAVWGDGMINATGFKPDGTTTSFSSIHPKGHPRAGSITWHWPEYVAPVTLQSLGFE